MTENNSDNSKDDFKENGLATRVKRYGQVSGTMAGLATKLAGEKFFGVSIDKDDHAKQLVGALGNLKGPLMKVGQILSTIPEALPEEYAQEFQNLQSNAPAMGWPFVRRRMKTELGPDWLKRFGSFEKEAAAAASLGQVHKALANNSQLRLEHFSDDENVNLACKLQYPDMRAAIDTDLQQLKIIFGLYGRYDKSIKTDNIHSELAERLHEELDYEREARHTKMYAHILRDEAGVHVPTVVESLSTDRLLTTTWLEGAPILSFKGAPLEDRNQLAINMFRAWYVPLYYYGVIHGDPHLGNYTVRPDLSINLLDFGCVRVFPPSFIGGVIDLYNALMTENIDLAVHAFETWGFENLSKEKVEILNIWAGFLYAPVMDDSVRTVGHAKGSVYGRETAEEVHKKLREISKAEGGVSVPREFVFMDRAALGLGSAFIHLQAEVNWYRLFNELIEGFDVSVLAAKQRETLADFDIKTT